MWLNKVKGLIHAPDQSASSIEGTYRVMKVHWNQEQQFGEGRILKLSDSSSELEVLLPSKSCRPWFKELHPYTLRLIVDNKHDFPFPIVDPASAQLATEYSTISLLPKAWTPRPDGIFRLVTLYQSLHTDEIKWFWENLFADEDWLRLFMQLPASSECHHAFPGGLFIHSIEVAENTLDMLLRPIHLTNLEKDAAITIALLHDATKAATATAYPERWQIPFASWQHERYLPYFLSPSLLRLKERNRNAYSTLIRLLDDYTRPKEQLNSPLSEIIRHSDHLSAHLDARHTQQKKDGGYRNWTKVCGRPYWGPITPKNTRADMMLDVC